MGIAFDVVDAAADFTIMTKRIMIVPLAHFLIQIIIFAMSLGALVSVISLNDVKASTTIAQGREITWSSDVWFLTVFMVFGVLWLLNLFDYLSRFIVIVSASTYYFNHKSDVQELNSDAAEVQYGFICAYVYHFGSIAMGSFIIGIVKFIKYVFYFLAKRL